MASRNFQQPAGRGRFIVRTSFRRVRPVPILSSSPPLPPLLPCARPPPSHAARGAHDPLYSRRGARSLSSQRADVTASPACSQVVPPPLLPLPPPPLLARAQAASVWQRAA